jgi:hypothetical protein
VSVDQNLWLTIRDHFPEMKSSAIVNEALVALAQRDGIEVGINIFVPPSKVEAVRAILNED